MIYLLQYLPMLKIKMKDCGMPFKLKLTTNRQNSKQRKRKVLNIALKELSSKIKQWANKVRKFCAALYRNLSKVKRSRKPVAILLITNLIAGTKSKKLLRQSDAAQQIRKTRFTA